MTNEFLLMEQAAAAALKVGERELIRYFHPEVLAKSQFKDHREFVTAADHASNRAIQSVLHRLTPNIPVVSEEGPLNKFQNPKSKDQSNLTWLLDPLDGTTNFVIGLPLWGISLALLQDGVPVRGWLTMPKLNERYLARLNQGAWRNGKKFHLTKKLTLKNSVGLFCHGYKEEEKAADLGVLGPLMHATLNTRRLGVACVETAWVATGRAAYLVIHGAHAWDLAAGALLITEAGGLVARPDGQPWRVTDQDMVGANPASFDKVIKITKK